MSIEQKKLQSYPLIKQYLGDHIRQLQARPPNTGRFVHLFSRGDPERLEKRLERTHKTTAFQTIFREVGNIKDPDELDRRLVDAWAEIRVIDQLMRERFIDICKVKTPADLVARYMSQLYAIQVTRISREPQFPDLPTGDLRQIYDGVKDLIGSYFWDSIIRKNLKFKDISPLEYVRRIVVVTSIDRLQNPLNRHIACRQIRDSILAFKRRYFEEVQWLPDLGNGAIFWVETSDGGAKVRCVTDWGDDVVDPHWDDYENCYWREVDLDSTIPAYVDQ
jgi:hypothetical protein